MDGGLYKRIQKKACLLYHNRTTPNEQEKNEVGREILIKRGAGDEGGKSRARKNTGTGK